MTENIKAKVISIDGPCGSGKSTIAKLLADKIGALYIDTGAMFRSIALSVKNAGIEFKESSELIDFINKLELQYGVSEDELVIINNKNLTDDIRHHEVSKYASQISQLNFVRDYLVKFQRGLVKKQVCVMEGRDIGTVVFPNAFCKFYLTASVKERATRRLNQLSEGGDMKYDLNQVIKDVEKRDHIDMTREHAPLKEAEDSILIDSTFLKTEDVLNKMSEIANLKASEFEINL